MYTFPPVPPRRWGPVSTVPTPIGRYLSASIEQGLHDNLFGLTERFTEDQLYDDGPLLSPKDANERFGMEGELNFTDPVREGRARLLSNRKRAELDRNFFLQDTSLLSMRGLTGMGAGMIASMANPLDFAANFMPIVGSEKYANLIGKGLRPWRKALVRGMFTEEGIQRAGLPFHRFVGSVINGTVSQVVYEVPLVIQDIRDQVKRDPGGYLLDIATGGAMAGAIHFGMTSIERLFRHLSPATKERVTRTAIEQFLKDEDINVHQLVKIDETAIRERVRFDEAGARERALKVANAWTPEEVTKLKATLFEKHGEVIEAAAIKLPDGRVLEGEPGKPHYSIGTDGISADLLKKATSGFVTDKGRFVDRAEAAKISGELNSPWIGDGKLAGEDIDPEGNLPDDQSISTSPEERARNAREYFFSTPEGQALYKQEYDKSIAEYIRSEREKYDETGQFNRAVQAEIQKQISEGRVLTPDLVKRYGFDKENIEQIKSTIEQQLKDLETELGVTGEAKPGELEEKLKKVDDFFDKLKVPMGKGEMHVFGILPATYNWVIDRIKWLVKTGISIHDAIDQAFKDSPSPWKPDQEKLARALLDKRIHGFVTDLGAQLNSGKPFGVTAGKGGIKVTTLLSKLQTLPTGEVYWWKMRGITKLLEGRDRISPIELMAWAAMNEPEVRVEHKMINNKRKFDQDEFARVRHWMETEGYDDGTADVAFTDEDTVRSPGIYHDGEKVAEINHEGKVVGIVPDEHLKMLQRWYELHVELNDAHEQDYTGGNIAVPKDVKEMIDPVTILVHAPRRPVNVENFTGYEDWPSSHFGPGVLGWVRAFTEVLPDGRKVLRIFEQQSDWRQGFKVLDRKKHGVSEGKPWGVQYYDESGRNNDFREGFKTREEAQAFVDKKYREYQQTQMPLVHYTTELSLKSAIKYAREHDLAQIVIDDAETAMMTEGHDVAAHNNVVSYHSRSSEIKVGDWGVRNQHGQIEVTVTKEAAENRLEQIMLNAADFTSINDLPEQMHETHSSSSRVDQVTEADLVLKVEQEKGMRQHYDATTVNVMKNLGGELQESVWMGEHYMASNERINQHTGQYGSPVFKDSRGDPKHLSTGRLFDISKIPVEEPFMLFSNKQYSEPLTPTERVMLEQIHEPIPDLVEQARACMIKKLL